MECIVTWKRSSLSLAVGLAMAWGAACASEAQSGTTTLKVSVRRVVVDVVVSDGAGKPVKGLTADDFRVFEDGKPQPVRSFEVYRADPQPPLRMPKLPPNTFSNFAGGPQAGPVSVVLYDLLNTPLDAQSYAREQLLSYLKQRQAAAPVAIFVLTDRLHMLQGFTDDDNLLIAALNQKNGRRYKSSNLQTGDEASRQSDQLDRTEGNSNSSADVRDAGFQAVSSMLKHMETMESSALLDRRVEVTAEALVEISSFLSGMPGRKNLIWLSGSFPAGVLPDPDLGDRDSLNVTRTYSELIQKATNALNQSHTAVYPVDVRGVQANPMFSGSSNVNFPPGSGKDLRAVKQYAQQQGADHATMDTIGDETGGHAFYNTNGLKEAISTAVADGSTYYSMTYSPSNTKADGGMRRIRVECLKAGYHLSYRQKYFADNAKSAPVLADEGANDAMALALRHGAPPAHELFFEAHVQTEGVPVAATPQQLALLARYRMAQDKKHPKTPASHGPVMMQHYLVSYALLGRQLDLPAGEDGVRHGDLEFAAMAFDDDGDTMDGIRTKVQDAIKPDRYAQIEKGAYELVQRIDIPIGAAALRIGVRDAQTGRMGSMELRLPLAATP
jgi:VWFA-related protein